MSDGRVSACDAAAVAGGEAAAGGVAAVAGGYQASGTREGCNGFGGAAAVGALLGSPV